MHHEICATAPFLCQGEEQFVTVDYGPGSQTVRRLSWSSQAVVDETNCPITPSGCAIEEIAVSASGNWLVTRRSSGQGEWGYDVFRSCPLIREAGVTATRGYMLELPCFSADETRLIGGFGLKWLGGWWAGPNDEPDDPVPGGVVSFGVLFVHHLPNHRVDHHALEISLPRGWMPDDPWAEEWCGPKTITPAATGVRLTLSWGVSVGITDPIPSVVRLPTPHPSSKA
jgi:hypothetical protein